MRLALIAAASFLLVWPVAGIAAPAVDAAQAEQVIQRCVSIYHESGYPCACAFDHARKGNRCGARSVHDRPHGAPSRWYLVTEITPELLRDFRTNEQALLRDRCHYHGR